MTFSPRVLTYYHVAAWPPEAVPIGHVCATRWRVSNYGLAQLDPGRLAEVECAAGGHTSLAVPDARLRELARSKAERQTGKESIFEAVREAEFPELPSRMNAMFLCESEAQARRASTHWGLAAGVYAVECLGFQEPASDPDLAAWGLSRSEFDQLRRPLRHRANPAFLDCNMAEARVVRERARAYWSGWETAAEDFTEVLFRGFFRVIGHLA